MTNGTNCAETSIRGAQTLDVQVSSKKMEALDICRFELTAVDGRELPPFAAGAHVDVYLPGGYVRQYSLCNDPTETHRYVLGVLRDPGSRGGSAAFHDQVAIGDILKISRPRNHFELSNAPNTLLFAGGIGITPILCMANHLSQTGAQFRLHYCARSSANAAFSAEVGAFAARQQAQFHFDDGDAAQRLDLTAALGNPVPQTQIYVCGPKGFIDWIVDTARDQGWPSEQVHVEFFGADAKNDGADKSFEIRLAGSNLVYTVPSGVSVASVLLQAGHDLPLSCESGFCGTCVMRVLEGVPDHRDTFLTDSERAANRHFTPCCSRALSNTLVIDL